MIQEGHLVLPFSRELCGRVPGYPWTLALYTSQPGTTFAYRCIPANGARQRDPKSQTKSQRPSASGRLSHCQPSRWFVTRLRSVSPRKRWQRWRWQERTTREPAKTVDADGHRRRPVRIAADVGAPRGRWVAVDFAENAGERDAAVFCGAARREPQVFDEREVRWQPVPAQAGVVVGAVGFEARRVSSRALLEQVARMPLLDAAERGPPSAVQ